MPVGHPADIHASADDVVRGIESAGLKNLGGVAILLGWLAAALMLVRRKMTYGILLPGSLLAMVIPATHFSGRGVDGKFAASAGGYFFIWTLFALGVVAAVS